MFESRYRKFLSAAPLATGRGEVELSASGACVVLSETDHELAKLYDGERDAPGVLAVAHERLQLSLDADELEGFAAQLSEVGLLRAGSHEPLPVPVQSDAEAQLLGWRGGGRRIPLPGETLYLPPSTVPGSRNSPGFLGRLIGGAGRIDVPFAPDFFVAFGRALIAPVASGRALLVFLAIVVAAVTAVIAHRLAWAFLATDAIRGWEIVPTVLLSMLLVNLFGGCARAAAIARYTPERPRLGLVLRGGWFPQLFVDSAGAAERVGRTDRLRIVGAGLVGVTMLMVIAIFGWFLSGHTNVTVSRYCVTLTIACALVVLLRLNPLAFGDGYFLLANALNQLDLRMQAMFALFGVERPWKQQTRAMPRAMLVTYAGSAIAFWLLVLVLLSVFFGDWLADRYGGLGFLFFVGALGTLMQKQYIRSGGGRSSLGVPKQPWKMSRKRWIVAAVAVVVALVPYHYEPSGSFEVLPGDRADVRALIDGDIREVMAQEGDMVKAGDVLVRLDDAAARAGLAGAQAERARLQSELTVAKKGAKQEEIEVARQKVAVSRKTHEVARAQAQRLQDAYKRKSVTAQDYERARGASDVAQQELLQAQRALELVASPVVVDRIKALEAAVAEADARIDLQKAALSYTQVTAPIAGQVVSQKLQYALGTYLKRGDLIATIEDNSREVRAEILIPEAAIVDVRLDGPASAKPWAYPGSSFDGKVLSAAPVAEEGDYGRVVRVQVLLQDPEGKLRSGLTGNAKVDGGWHPAIVVFTRALVRFLLVEFWSWVP